MKLYKVETVGLGTHWVCALDPTAAYELLRKEWDEKDYGFVRDRQMRSISLIADMVEYPQGCDRLWY